MQSYESETAGEVWETHSFGVQGMTCDHCAKTVTKALKAVGGVKEVNVDRAGAVATVTFDKTKTTLPAVRAAVLKAGFKSAA